jgi:hypothetical protein
MKWFDAVAADTKYIIGHCRNALLANQIMIIKIRLK